MFNRLSTPAILILILGCGPARMPSPPQRPNVLFIMGDQHHARALGCAGNPEVRTPHLDRLARGGVRFENAFTQTGQCCPSRYTIFTGRYARSHGCRWNGVREPASETTIAELLRADGYATASIGKHHMRQPMKEHGFDEVVDRAEHNAALKKAGKPPAYRSGDWLPFKISGVVGASHASNEDHPSGFWATEAIRFIRDNRDRPFCTWLSFYGPHTPIAPSRPWADMYDPDDLTLPGNFNAVRESYPRMMSEGRKKFAPMTERDHRKTLALYYGLVTQIDHNIGRVLGELERLGLTEKTIVVYTTDHGEMMGEHRTWTKFVTNYESTVRIPMMIRFPKVLPSGKVVRELAGLIDLMPTLCELTGRPIPANVQGKSLVRVARGDARGWRQVIFSEIGYPGKNSGRCVMARTLTHKYIHHENFGTPAEELFDLSRDPWETRNEISNPRYASIAAGLRDRFRRWEQETENAPLYPVEPKRKRR